MIVGQEPFGWGEWVHDDTDIDVVVDRLLTGYDEFALGSSYRRSPSWAAANKIFARLQPAVRERNYLWSNRIKIAQNGRRPLPVVEEAICAIPLLGAELRAFTPDVVVFFTGPYYDDRLAASFPGVVATPLSAFVNRLSGHDALPERTFRSYHPGYLRRAKKWAVIEELASCCQVI